MRIPATLLLLTLALVAVRAAIPAESGLTGPNWSWAAAESAIESVDTGAALEELNRLAAARQDDAVLERISWLAVRPDWPVPAREYALFSFTRSLAEREPGTVDRRILQQLSSIRPQVRIPHPDDDRLGMVLFNIPAAASGAASEWRRREAAHTAAVLLSRGTSDWISGYRAGDVLTRQGYLASLDDANIAPLNELAGAIGQHIGAQPELAAPLARIGIILADEERFAQALGGVPIRDVAQLTRAAGRKFDVRQALRILDVLEQSAPAPTTSVVLAELAATLIQTPKGTERLFALVEDESLGLTAALALARHGDEATLQRLGAIASEGQNGPARRAMIALSAPRSEASAP